jgi:hypothetical protein
MHPLMVMDTTTIAAVAMSNALPGNGKNVFNQIEGALGPIEDGSYGHYRNFGAQASTHPYTIADRGFQ